MSLSTTEVRALSLLLDRCLALPPPQREAWLAALPEPQQVLVPRLRQRLAELAPAALPAAGDAAPAPAPPPPRTHPRHGERVGPYRLLQPLPAADAAAAGADEGWLAERAADAAAGRSPSMARAPLALMLLPAGSARRTVAPLPRHAGIVTLLDAGIDAEGRAWRVLPAWPATGLVEHARRRRLDALQRVALLLPVVEAVAGAHAAATAHGHLDAAVVRVNDEGRALLLDWGRARRLDAASAAADVAGLGGLLHALLAEPVAAGRVGPDLRAVLARTAPGTQALRHASVAELAADLRRVVDGEPVAGATPGHRVALALRRHRAGAAAGAVLLLLLALGGFLAARQHAESRARAQRSAQAEAFLAAAHAADAGLPAAQQAQRTQQALEAARTGFAGDPLLRGRVLTGLALRFRELGQPEQALAVLGEAQALLERTAGGDPALPAVRAELAWELLRAGAADAPARAAELARAAVAGCGAGAECDAVRERAQAVRDRLAATR